MGSESTDDDYVHNLTFGRIEDYWARIGEADFSGSEASLNSLTVESNQITSNLWLKTVLPDMKTDEDSLREVEMPELQIPTPTAPAALPHPLTNFITGEDAWKMFSNVRFQLMEADQKLTGNELLNEFSF